MLKYWKEGVVIAIIAVVFSVGRLTVHCPPQEVQIVSVEKRVTEHIDRKGNRSIVTETGIREVKETAKERKRKSMLGASVQTYREPIYDEKKKIYYNIHIEYGYRVLDNVFVKGGYHFGTREWSLGVTVLF